jgi:hypothetical protein
MHGWCGLKAGMFKHGGTACLSAALKKWVILLFVGSSLDHLSAFS